MNENFNLALEQSGMSMYALARCSGVPYTTINEIHNCRNDINQCATGTVFKLAASLERDAGDILNPIRYLDGTQGRYGRISYIWSYDNGSQISFDYEGERVVLNTGKDYNIPARLKYYNEIAGWLIRDFIERKEWEKAADTEFAGRR